jgi:hypothetical protein
MLLGAYQILYSNIAQHASIYETVNIADGLDKPWRLIALKRLVQNTSLYQNLEGDKHQWLDLTLAPVVQL